MNWNIIGHQWAVDLLKAHIRNQRLRHAYLITGPSGIGRCTLATRFAQAINCKNITKKGDPCFNCSNCKRINKFQHPDLLEINSGKVGGTIKIAQIRELKKWASLSPYESKYKIAIIQRIEEANPNASNALLKTLEEPPSNVIIVITGYQAHSLLPTITSRCEILRLRTVSNSDIQFNLVEDFNIPIEMAELYTRLSNGKPGEAIRYMQNKDYEEERHELLTQFISLFRGTRIERFRFAEELSKDKDSLIGKLWLFATVWHDLVIQISGSSLPVTNLDFDVDIGEFAKVIDLNTAKSMLLMIEKTSSQIKKNINTRLALEVLMLQTPFIN